MGNEELVDDVLGNLISNAIKYTPQGGKVSIILEKEREDLLKIEILDTGIGIPEKDMEELRAIYKATGDLELMEAIEKGMEKKLGSKEEVEKYWQTWLETGDSRNYQLKKEKEEDK
ncbi:MAG: ATP-binding protein [Candidatus Bathyarchaeia archaeon]